MELNEIEKEIVENYRKSAKQDKIIISKRARMFAAVADKTRREKE